MRAMCGEKSVGDVCCVFCCWLLMVGVVVVVLVSVLLLVPVVAVGFLLLVFGLADVLMRCAAGCS